jgi:hypothetical protein
MYIFYNTDDKLQIVNEVLLIILIVLDRRNKTLQDRFITLQCYWPVNCVSYTTILTSRNTGIIPCIRIFR